VYPSPNIVRAIKSRRMKWVGYIACRGDRRGMYKDLVAKPERKRPLGRPRHRWEYSIKMDLWKVGCGGVEMNFRVP
jgi:hypothetical protein